MIRIERGTSPISLTSQSTRWLEELRQERIARPKLSADEFWKKVRQRKAMKQFASQLIEKFHRKCVYCEANPSHVSALHIEHYRPKSVATFEALMFDWNNWLVACSICNSAKGTYWEECNGSPCIIDPSTEDPGLHVKFKNAQIVPISNRGQKTIHQLRLQHRSDLLDERGKWLNYIGILLIILTRLPEAAQSARLFLIWSMQDNAPYAAMTRAYLSEKTPKLANPAQPHPIIKIDEPAKRISELIEAYREQLQIIH